MLSSQEREKLRDQLNHIPKWFTTQQRQDFQRTIKKKLKEDEYASKFPRFTPTNYEIIFVNRTTTIETLTQLINLIDHSTFFTLDTESTNIPRQPNKPSLIQVQILQPDDNSKIIFIEACFLPGSDQYTFTLIKQLFYVLLQPKKIIFTWGDLNELKTFTRYDLFTNDQIVLPEPVNVQTRFRTYWSNNYPHQQTESSNDISICKCLYCFGITHDGLISIQDAVAISLHQWIDKRLTRHPFDIGLDPQLKKINDKQLQYRKSMCAYAANDCDAVKQIIIYTNIINEKRRSIEHQHSTFLIDETSSPNSPPNIFTDILQEEPIEEQSFQNKIREQELEFDLEKISEDDDDLIVSSTTKTNRNVIVNQPSAQRTSQLPLAQRRQIHNRTCTLRQRRRLYQHKVSCYDIDNRFSIRKIKQLLDDNHIQFTAVNTVRSKSTNKTILYVGVKDSTFIKQYQELIQHLFKTKNYDRIYHRNVNYFFDNHRRPMS